MKRKFLSFLLLAFSAVLFLACTNLLDAEKKSSDTKGIVLSLPYGKSNKVGVFRAADDKSDKVHLSFKVVFKHESGEETAFEGKSGDTIVFKEAPVGKYTITVQGFNEGNVLKYQGETPAEVKEGETTNVTVTLKKIKVHEEVDEKEPENPDPEEEDIEVIEINLLGMTDEQAKMIEKYIEANPKCGIHVNFKEVKTTNGEYAAFLDSALTGKSDLFVPDIYVAEAAFVLRYTKGEMSSYALPFKDFIPDLDSKISEAGIAQYTVDLGKNSDGNILGLAYQTTGGAFIYRRSLAKQIFGTDDPRLVSTEIGGSSGKWDKFFEAAAECAKKDVAIVSGDGDLWHPVEGSAEKGWVVDNKLIIDSKREAFLDYSKELYTKGWSNKTTEWSAEWLADARGKGEKPVLGFFGPAWLINYTLEPACNQDDTGKVVNDDRDWAICDSPVGFFWGGTWLLANKNLKNDTSEEGLKKLEAVRKIIEWITLDATEDGAQYKWANGMLDNSKDTVTSKVVMDMSDGKLNFLNGQNMYDYYIPSNSNPRAELITEYDDVITALWRFEVNKYAEGLTTRSQALNNFKYAVYTNLGLKWEDFDTNGLIYETEHVRAEPDPEGRGIKFTISAKEGEEWQENSARIFETDSGLYIKIKETNPVPGTPIVCYYPFTEDGKGYAFDCEFKVGKDAKAIHETVYSIAKGNYATVEADTEAFSDFKPVVNLKDATVKLSKDLSSSVSYSDNVTPYIDFGTFTNDTKEAGKYTWTAWLNSTFPDFGEPKLYGEGAGIPILALNSNTVRKLEKTPYFFVDASIEFFVSNLPERFGYRYTFKSDIYDASDLINNLTDNCHISVEPHDKGIQITLRRLEGEGEWVSWNRVYCITSEGKQGVSFEANSLNLDADGNYLGGNERPTADKPEVIYYYPFTEAGKRYEFEFAGPIVENGDWCSEYVCCTAGGGIGELINAEGWEYINLSDVNYSERSFKINGNVANLIDNRANDFTFAQLFVDVRPGTEEGLHREAKFNYASRPVLVIGDASKYTWMRSLPDLNNTFIIEADPTAAGADSEDVVSVLSEYGNKFYVKLSLNSIRVKEVQNMEFFLPWK